MILVPVAGAAAAAGLLVPGLYRDPGAVVPAMRGQDLVTLVVSVLLLNARRTSGRGSYREALISVGILAYMLYAFTGAAFAYRFNQLFLLYIVGFSLSLAALIARLVAIDIGLLRQAFDAGTPRRSVAAFLGFIALVLGISEGAQIIEALSSNTLPALIAQSQGAGNFVYVLDLGVIVPLSVMGGWLLVRDRPWGYVLAGGMLIKALTMGMALIASTWFSVRSGLLVEPGLTLAYALIACGAIALSVWFFRHCCTSVGKSENSHDWPGNRQKSS